MFELVFIAGFGFLAFRSTKIRDEELSALPRRISDKLGKLRSHCDC